MPRDIRCPCGFAIRVDEEVAPYWRLCPKCGLPFPPNHQVAEAVPVAEPAGGAWTPPPSPAYDEERVPPLEFASTAERAVTTPQSETGDEAESSEPTISTPENS